MKYYFSPETLSFFPESIKSQYDEAGSWPGDGVEVSEEIFMVYSKPAPVGKVRGNIGGRPAWVDAPVKTIEQLISEAQEQRLALLNQANAVTADWRTELSLGMIGDSDKASLMMWMQYIRDVKAVDVLIISKGYGVEWPIIPS